MRRQVTLFQYLYGTLTMQIRTEKIRYGESLPSIRQLCVLYNVGIRTVKDVLKAMSDDGYIKTEVRKNAVCIYKSEQGSDPLEPVKMLLARKEAVIDMLQALTCLFPHIIASGAMLCTPQCLAEMRQRIKQVNPVTPKEKWREGTAVAQKLIALHNSSLLTDLYIDMDLYGQVAIFDGFENPFRSLTYHSEKGIEYVFELIERAFYDGLYANIERLFAASTSHIRRYLDELSAVYPQFADVEKTPFTWDAKKGRVFSYMEISRQITAKIGQGVYPDHELIPTIAELMKEYKASPTTVGKALAVLNNIGLLQTVNGRGSLVTLGNAKAVDFVMRDAAMKRDADTFLCAMQLRALSCKTIALLGFDKLDKAAIERMTRSVEDMTNLTLPNDIMSCLVAVQPYDALRLIHTELSDLLTWGYYYTFARQDNTHYQSIRKRCRKALYYVRLGEKYAFSDILQEIYIDIFVTLKKTLLSHGADESRDLTVPRPDSYAGKRLMVP